MTPSRTLPLFIHSLLIDVSYQEKFCKKLDSKSIFGVISLNLTFLLNKWNAKDETIQDDNIFIIKTRLLFVFVCPVCIKVLGK